MENTRFYGTKPYKAVLVHGGPGALGDMGYLAEQLSEQVGIIEALQTKSNIDDLMDELASVIEKSCEEPVIIVGHSWGAWLSYLVAAERPELITKLILIGSGPFKEEYVEKLETTRMSRLTEAQKVELNELIKQFFDKDNDPETKSVSLGKIGSMMEIADTYHLQEIDDEKYGIKVDGNLFQNIWNEASQLRASGELLSLGNKILCDVTIIHGEYDPHPVEGVVDPLKEILKNMNVVVLEKCGHTPWKEEYAHERFLEVMKMIIR